ncbi:MAG: Sir2 family NAD-dependent protein deacetylase [Chitinophagaceae bacterium]
MKKPVIVVLTGAGISAESGLRTFRDTDGLWEGFDVEDVATPRAWLSNQPMVQEFYNQRRRDVAAATPNLAHKLLAALEKDFRVRIVTQNIDDLHERAGSTNVLHLHGQIFKMRSDKQPHDDKFAQEIREDIPPGLKAEDGGLMRPHIVWFEEMVPTIMEAQTIMQTADIFILVGTSLVVYPAAGLVDFVPRDAPKYIIDKVIPEVGHYEHIIPIAKPATAGMTELSELLLKKN